MMEMNETHVVNRVNRGNVIYRVFEPIEVNEMREEK